VKTNSALVSYTCSLHSLILINLFFSEKATGKKKNRACIKLLIEKSINLSNSNAHLQVVGHKKDVERCEMCLNLHFHYTETIMHV